MLRFPSTSLCYVIRNTLVKEQYIRLAYQGIRGIISSHSGWSFQSLFFWDVASDVAPVLYSL
jgi:hypothetical protein